MSPELVMVLDMTSLYIGKMIYKHHRFCQVKKPIRSLARENEYKQGI